MTQEKTKETKKLTYTYAHGRRKEAVARARLFKGKGEIEVNDKKITDYFPLEVHKSYYKKPFFLTKTEDVYYATVKVTGSGKKGQLDAVVHAISNALVKENSEFRPMLKKAGLLKRDPRVKERRKYGRAQKARKGKQSPKR